MPTKALESTTQPESIRCLADFQFPQCAATWRGVK